MATQYEIRRVPKIVIPGGDALANMVTGRWVHYTIGDVHGRMLKTEWDKLRRVNRSAFSDMCMYGYRPKKVRKAK